MKFATYEVILPGLAESLEGWEVEEGESLAPPTRPLSPVGVLPDSFDSVGDEKPREEGILGGRWSRETPPTRPVRAEVVAPAWGRARPDMIDLCDRRLLLRRDLGLLLLDV